MKDNEKLTMKINELVGETVTEDFKSDKNGLLEGFGAYEKNFETEIENLNKLLSDTLDRNAYNKALASLGNINNTIRNLMNDTPYKAYYKGFAAALKIIGIYSQEKNKKCVENTEK